MARSPLFPQQRTWNQPAATSASCRYCCKTLFGSLKTNFLGCGRSHRIIVWGTTATSDKLTRNFGTALEDTSIGDCRLVALFAEKSLQAIFGVLQHYPPDQQISLTDPDARPMATSGEASVSWATMSKVAVVGMVSLAMARTHELL
jgi:hypothetical protein